MPVVIDRSDKGSGGEPPKKKDGSTTAASKVSTPGSKKKKKTVDVENPRVQMAKTLLLGVVIVAALAFVIYYFMASRKGKDTVELGSKSSTSTNPSPAATAAPGGQMPGATGRGNPRAPKAGEGPVPAPRLGR